MCGNSLLKEDSLLVVFFRSQLTMDNKDLLYHTVCYLERVQQTFKRNNNVDLLFLCRTKTFVIHFPFLMTYGKRIYCTLQQTKRNDHFPYIVTESNAKSLSTPDGTSCDSKTIVKKIKFTVSTNKQTVVLAGLLISYVSHITDNCNKVEKADTEKRVFSGNKQYSKVL
jgi:hypothetical protein